MFTIKKGTRFLRTGQLALGLALMLFTDRTVLADTIRRTVANITPTPNGTTDAGTVRMDTRTMIGLAIDPPLIRFAGLDQSLQVRVKARLSDRSRYDVTASVFRTTYSVDDPMIASITPEGLVRPVADGTTIVNAFHLGRQARSIIIVDTLSSSGTATLAITPSSLEFSAIGESRQLAVRAILDDGSTADVTAHSATRFESDNVQVVRVVPSGRTYALGAGTATITISHGVAIATISASVTIPSDKALTSLQVRPGAARIRTIGSAIPLSVLGVQRGGALVDLTSALVGTTYRSDGSTVAAVSEGGIITGLANGTAAITVSNSGLETSILVRVSVSTLESLSITPNSSSVLLQFASPTSTQQLTVLGLYSDGSFETFTSSASGTTYRSSNPGVATVGPSGLVTFQQPGTVQVTASTSGIAAVSTITVTSFRPSPLGAVRGLFTNVAAQGNIAFLTAGIDGLRIVDVSAPFAPVIVATAGTAGNMLDVKVAGTRAFVAETSGLAVFDVSMASRPVRNATIPGLSILATALEGNRLYFTDGSTMRILDASSLATLGELQGLPGEGQSIAVSGGLAFVAMGAAGVAVVDVGTPSAPVLATTVVLDAGAFNVASRGRIAFVPVGADGKNFARPNPVVVIDAGVPLAARVVSTTSVLMTAHGVAVSGDLLLAAEDIFVNSMPIFNISDPGNPVYLGTIDFPGDAEGLRVAVAGDLTLLVNNPGPDSGLYIAALKPPPSSSPPAVALTSPATGGSAAEGSVVRVAASASDALGVSRVDFLVDGVPRASVTQPPYEASLRIPFGTAGRGVRLGAQAVNVLGLRSPVAEVTLQGVAAPVTRIEGRLVNGLGAGLGGIPLTASIESAGVALIATTAADGSFVFRNVPLIGPAIEVRASTTVVAEAPLYRVPTPDPFCGDSPSTGRIFTAGVRTEAALSAQATTAIGNLALTTEIPRDSCGRTYDLLHLPARLSPYSLESSLRVPVASTATIEAGVIVKAGADVNFRVQGTLLAAGKLAEPIVYTGLSDDRFGGDTYRLRTGQKATGLGAVRHQGIESQGGTGELRHARVAFAHRGITATTGDRDGASVGSNLQVFGSTIEYCELGLEVTNSTATVSNATFFANTTAIDVGDIFRDETGTLLASGSLFDGNGTGIMVFKVRDGSRIADNRFTRGTSYGVHLSRADDQGRHFEPFSFEFSGNTFDGNLESPIALSDGATLAEDVGRNNTFRGNSRNGIGLRGVVSGSTTLAPHAGLPYVLDALEVAGRLTVAPGVTIKSRGSGLRVRPGGHLEAVGASSAPIVITSLLDDSFGGDTNNDGAGPIAQEEVSAGIVVEAQGSARLEHLKQLFGGNLLSSFEGFTPGLRIHSSSVTVSEVTLSSGEHSGIMVVNAAPSIRNVLIAGGGLTARIGAPQDRPFTVMGSTIQNAREAGMALEVPQDSVIQGNLVTGSAAEGIRFEGGTVPEGFSRNTVSGNQIAAKLRGGASASRDFGADNSFVNNGISGIGMCDWSGQASTWVPVSGLPYVFTGGCTVAAPGLQTLAAGVVAKFTPGSQLLLNGGLEAIGSPDKPVVFTSLKDDSVGGDTNGDGGASSPASRDWVGISVLGSSATISFARLRYGGDRGDALLEVSQQGSAALSRSDIQFSGGDGIRANNGSAIDVSSCVISGNAIGVRIGGASTGLIRASSISGNGVGAAAESGLSPVDAAHNWWGSPSGPRPGGQGDPVSGDVLFTPFLREPPSEAGAVPGGG